VPGVDLETFEMPVDQELLSTSFVSNYKMF
jgi:hypothetical protein